MLSIDKDRPSPAWIASLRERFPTERELDRVLTRRMHRRSGPAYTPVSLQTLVEGVESLIRAHYPADFTLSGARWLTGGASKLQMAFVLDWVPAGGKRERTPMVLRMEPSESLVESSRLREFQLIRAISGTVPVPQVYWCDEEGRHLPYPALVYGFATGVAKPSNTHSNVSGMGATLPPELRAKLAPQFVDYLAKIHTFDFTKADLTAFDVPASGTQCAEWGINFWSRVFEEDCDEDVPLFRIAAGWLKRNMPKLEKPGIVHGDYRVGNFLFTEHDSRISAWLDWELGRIGDYHQDLAWVASSAYYQYDRDGTLLLNGLMTQPAFLEAYEQASGNRVNGKTFHWYKVYNCFLVTALTLGTGFRIAKNGKTHQDVLVTWLSGVGYLLMDEMRALIEGAP